MENGSHFKMIDVGSKIDTHRIAVASGVFIAAKETLSRIASRALPKGDALLLAEVAGIQGAKSASQMLPLCHPLTLNSVRVWCEPSEFQITVFCEVKSFGKTGIEMEALCGVNAALLCIYDLTKGIDPNLTLQEIKLLRKEGGKSDISLSSVRAAVLVLSDRCHRGEQEDLSGKAAFNWLEQQNAQVTPVEIIPDEPEMLTLKLVGWLERSEFDLIITSGGTGISKRDITPETVLALCEKFQGREITGFGEWLRTSGSNHTPLAWLSRSTAVLIRNTLIVCLPGSPKAVLEGLNASAKLIQHALEICRG